MANFLFTMTTARPDKAAGTRWAIRLDDISYLEEESATTTRVYSKEGYSRIADESLDKLAARINQSLGL